MMLGRGYRTFMNLLFAMYLILLNIGCSKIKSNLDLIVYLQDISASSNNPDFKKKIDLVCDAIGKNLRKGDSFAKFAVGGDTPIYSSPVETNPKAVKESCARRTISNTFGTKTKEPFELANKAILEKPDSKPLLVIQIDSNETESDPIETWRKVVSNVIDRDGFVLIVGSTNRGGENFNSNLAKALDGLNSQKNIKFVGNNSDITTQVQKAMR